jgi:hypothetical protein
VEKFHEFQALAHGSGRALPQAMPWLKFSQPKVKASPAPWASTKLRRANGSAVVARVTRHGGAPVRHTIQTGEPKRAAGTFELLRPLKLKNLCLNRHFTLADCLSMIFSENRYPLFGIMLY